MEILTPDLYIDRIGGYEPGPDFIEVEKALIEVGIQFILG